MEEIKQNYIVGIDASRALENKRTGTENYSYQIIKAIAREDCEYNFRLYVRPEQSMAENLGSNRVEIKTINWSSFWTQGGLAFESWLNSPDLLFIPAHVVPFLKCPYLPVVVTVHDLRTEFLPQHQDLRQSFYLGRWIEFLRSRLATHIIAVSESTKKDLVNFLKVPETKITLIYEGIDQKRFTPKLKMQKQKLFEVKNKYGINGEYVLFVGTIQPRKNLVRLIKAFAQIKKSNPELQLVLVGKRGWLTEDIYKEPQRSSVETSVRFLDYVADDDLPYLYAGAKVFVFPSLYEGFGLPILEALSVGIPVVTSNISSMPEVGGNLAIYVNPLKEDDIANGIRIGMLTKLDENEINKHISKFSWEKAGKETCEIFKRILMKD